MADRVRHIPEATVARLPVYLRSLAELVDEKTATVSSERLAEMAGVNAAKVRKDLSYLGSYGTRGVGYDVEYLLFQMSRELGLTHDWPVVIMGAGNLGQAHANYGGFTDRGFPVAALVDADPVEHPGRFCRLQGVSRISSGNRQRDRCDTSQPCEQSGHLATPCRSGSSGRWEPIPAFGPSARHYGEDCGDIASSGAVFAPIK